MAKSPSSGDNSWRPVLFVSIGVGLAFLSMGSLVLLSVAMLPTVVAYFIDRTPQRYATFCVGGMNFAGTFPSLLDLWRGANTMRAAGETLTDVFAMIVIYGGAAFGWMVYLGIPPVIGAILTVVAQRRVQRLRAEQRQLIADWGDSLPASAGAAPPDGEAEPAGAGT